MSIRIYSFQILNIGGKIIKDVTKRPRSGRHRVSDHSKKLEPDEAKKWVITWWGAIIELLENEDKNPLAYQQCLQYHCNVNSETLLKFARDVFKEAQNEN